MRTVVVTCVAALLVSVAASGRSAVGAQACRAVRHPQLEALLPVLPGFQRQQPVGETDDVEHVARVTVDYEGREATISVELMDSCRNPDMLSQIREVLAKGGPVTRGTTMRSLPIRGYPAYEEWTAESKHGEVHVLVADRFMVKVTGDFVDSLKVVEGAAEAIDLQRLAALK